MLSKGQLVADTKSKGSLYLQCTLTPVNLSLLYNDDANVSLDGIPRGMPMINIRVMSYGKAIKTG